MPGRPGGSTRGGPRRRAALAARPLRQRLLRGRRGRARMVEGENFIRKPFDSRRPRRGGPPASHLNIGRLPSSGEGGAGRSAPETARSRPVLPRVSVMRFGVRRSPPRPRPSGRPRTRAERQRRGPVHAGARREDRRLAERAAKRSCASTSSSHTRAASSSPQRTAAPGSTWARAHLDERLPRERRVSIVAHLLDGRTASATKEARPVAGLALLEVPGGEERPLARSSRPRRGPHRPHGLLVANPGAQARPALGIGC